MRILGEKIKDYYDIGMSFTGNSEDYPIYSRVQSYELGSDLFDKYKINTNCNAVIGFCGVLYQCLITIDGILYPHLEKDYNILKDRYVEKKNVFKDYCNIIEDTPWRKAPSFAPIINHDIFRTLDCPIFVIMLGDNYYYYDCGISERIFKGEGLSQVSEEKIFGMPISNISNGLLKEGILSILIKNPILKDFNFHRIIKPYIAFQEIEMYLGGILANTKTPPMPVGSDKVIAESKGYDKWSFRKMPIKKSKK